MINDIEIRRLRYFVAIANSGSFVQASKVLNVAQPALSQQISNLEGDIGARVFRRTSRGVELSKAGELLFSHAGRVLAAMDRAREDLTDLIQDRRMRLEIVVPASISQMIAADLYQRLQGSSFAGSLNLHDATGDFGRSLLVGGHLSLALTYRPIVHDGIDSIPILTEDLHLVSLPGDAASSLSVALADLEHVPLVLPALPNGMRETIDEVAAEAGVILDVRAESNTLATLMTALRAGIGGTLLPIAPIQAMIAGNEVVARRIVDPAIERTLFLAVSRLTEIRREDRHLVRIILELIHDMIENGTWPGATPLVDADQMDALLTR